MFIYYMKLAIKSIRRNIWLSSLMVLAVALGIGACMTTITVNYMMSANPIPHKSDQLFYVQLDNWGPHFPFNDENEPPDQVTWRDANNLMQHDRFKQVAMGTSGGVIESDNREIKPFMAGIRLTYTTFFNLFEPPFLYGGPWQPTADKNSEQVVVLSKKTNQQVFGGENSVGRTLTIAGNRFRVVGVLDDYEPIPRFYDVTTGAFQSPEDVFMPLTLKLPLELGSSGNNSCWKDPDGDGFEGFLMSECINYQFWVQLDNAAEQEQYMSFLNAYVEEQKALGRFPRPLNNRISSVMEWMEIQEVVADDAQIMMWLAALFLLVCLLNTVGLLLSKYATRTADIALRRAIGAPKQAIFSQYITESALIGIIGGVLGLVLALAGIEAVKSMYGDFVSEHVAIDLTMVTVAIALAVISSVLAGCYPAYKACSVPPATQLRNQ
ncbi:ABC transporter permease [Alteromonas ponticola]|uniref:FtsX-like permease family protein n=1 Tax=Alteromonas ponticola TaxID=2720613 RepID=A0ABX1QZ41_9ALTE|nr:ABC transporter permease [Alteromonas ponticola]NMH58452.1 FtsX-like permease family protein [Alteromonas ponticola]